MNTLFIGQSDTGKTENIKKLLPSLDGKVIILDFKNQYEGTGYPVFLLDQVNPIIGSISLNDAKAINAGYVHDSHCLYRKCEELLQEYCVTEKTGLIEEVVERLHISWNPTEMAYGKLFSSKIPLRKNKNHISVDDAIERILATDRIILKGKSMHSNHIRAVTFAILSKLSREYNQKVTIIADDLTTFLNNGNLSLFFDTVNHENLSFILAFNKVTYIPKAFIPLIDTYHIHKFQNRLDLKELVQLPIALDNDDITNIRHLELNECIVKKTMATVN